VHAETKAKKMWPLDRLERLLKHFLSRHPEFVVFVLGRENPDLDVGEHNEQVIPCGGLPFAVSLSLLASVDLFLGVDSCMLHGADLFRVPGVGLFGPTSCVEFGFRWSLHHHVCGQATMETIHERDVLDALEDLLAHHCSPSGAPYLGASQTTMA